MKRLVEDFDDMMNIEDEVSVEDTKSPLEKELIRVYDYLKDKGETDIKAYEVAYQEAIENIYPENSWWEVIDLNIFWDLFENQNPRTTIDNIISSIKPEFKKEVIDTVVTEDIEEENPLKDIRSNIIEFPNGEYAYVEYADGKLYAGSATNRGIIHEYEMDYDKDFDVDRNLQDFFDKIIEENPELGEPLDESKEDKVCEDTVKQDNKWVNKGKDGTHGTFKTKKAADAQRKAMFANKGKKSTFGESFKVGDTFTNAGEEWEILRSEGDYTLVYAKDRKFHPYVVVYRLDDDGTWAQGHYFSNKDSAEKFLMNETNSVNESVCRKKRAIKESDDDFVIFEQEPDDFIDTDWYFDYDGIDYYIDGGRDFDDINEDFLNKKVDEEAIQRAFGEVLDDMSDEYGYQFVDVGDIFDFFNKDSDIVKALSAGLGEPYESASLTGSVQREWATIYYPKREYSREDIQEIEDYYFGKVTAWYNDDYGRAVIADTELGSHYNDSAKIKELISDYTGAPVDKIKLRRFNGYHQVADYIDESKQRRRSNRCVTEAKKEKLDKSTKQWIKVFKGLFDGLVHWNNNFSAYAPMDESTLKQRIQKLFKKVDSTISDGTSFTNRFKTAYKILLKAGVSLDKSPSTIKRLCNNLSQKYEKMAEQYKDDRSDRYENGKLADLYFSYASEFEHLSDFVDEVNAEINKDINESLSKKTKAKRIYESMKRKPKKNLKEAADDDLVFIDNRKSSIVNNDPSLDPGFDEYDVSDFTERKRKPKKNLKEESFKPSDTGIQSVKCYNQHNYTIQELRVDNDNKTFERGDFTFGKPDKKTKNRQEFEDIVDSLKELGYTEIKSDYHSMRNKSRKGVPTNEAYYAEAADDEIRLFMNTWANYNENGADDGITPTGWMSLDEAEEYAEKYAEYEPFINDMENVPKELGINEYSNIPETVDMLRKYEDFDDWQREIFAAFIDDGYEVDEAFDIVDDGDYVYIQADNDADLAENYIDDMGGIEELGRDTLEQYFDYDAFGRDLAYDFIKTEHGYVSH